MVLYVVSCVGVNMPKHTIAEPLEETPNTLTVCQFAHVFPVSALTETLDSFGCGTVRVRQTTKEALVYYQMMLALFRDYSQGSAFRVVVHALNALLRDGCKISEPTPTALIQGLDRIKPEVFESLYHRFAAPAGDVNHPGIAIKGRRTVSIDGFTLTVEDTKANRKRFGGPRNQHGEIGLPQLRAVALHETGTHLIFKAAWGKFDDGETTIAKSLIRFVQPNWLLLADRNFYSFKMYQEISNTGAAVIFRLQRGLALSSDEQLNDGSHLVTIYDSEDERKEHGATARLIQYRVCGAKKKTETFYLITNLLDPGEYSATELAQAYAERWEHETALDELKTHLNVNRITLRGKNPARVLREFWAMLMSYFSIRSLMYKAAATANLDPDRLSFTRTVEIIQENIIVERNATCTNCGHSNRKQEKDVLSEITDKPLPERRARSSNRSRRRHKDSYPVSKGRKKSEKTNTRVKVKKGWDYPKRR